MNKAPLKGISRLRAAWNNSLAGLRDIWTSEEAFRLEIVLLALSLPLAVWIGETPFRICSLVAVILLILIVEVLNTALEAVVDRIGPERHELSRIAKDLGSLAVVLASLLAGVVWIGALVEKLSG